MKYGKSLNRTEIYINIYQNVWFVIKVSHREKNYSIQSFHQQRCIKSIIYASTLRKRIK